MNRINLIPGEVLGRRRTQERLRRWGVLVGGTALVLTLLYAGVARVAAGRDAEVEAVSSRYTHLQQRLQYAQLLIQERDRLTHRQEAVRAIRDPLPAAMVLEILGSALTPDSYLTHVSLSRSTPIQSEKEEARTHPMLGLHGRAPGHSQVAEIISSLSQAEGVRTVVLLSARDIAPREAQASEVEFQLQCLLMGGPNED